MQHNQGSGRTFTAGAALEKYRRVKLTTAATSPATVVYAGAGERSIGVTMEECESGDKVAVRCYDGGSIEVEIGAAVSTPGIALFGAANGKLSTVESGEQEAISLAIGSGDGAVIEVQPQYNFTPAS